VKASAIIPCDRETETIERSARRTPIAGMSERGTRWPLLLIVHRTLWGALVAAFLFCSAPVMKHEILRDHFGPVDSFHSISRYLWGPNSPGRAEPLFHMLSVLPENRKVVIFMREDDLNMFHGVLMSYLAWPHQMQLISCGEEVAAERLGAIRPESVAAVIFCETKAPSWFPSGMRCGPGMRIVRLKEAGVSP
jgi:hypothetical protein